VVSEQALCGCGHTRRWHGDLGRGGCEAPQCVCLHFTEYVKLPIGPVRLADVGTRMLELEHAIPLADERDDVPVADVIAVLCSIEPGEQLEAMLELQMGRAAKLAREHYGPWLQLHGAHDMEAIMCAIGFLQGVTFLRAITDVREQDE